MAAPARPRGRSTPRRAAGLGLVLFRAAGGPRAGYGHVVRALQLARALGVPARVSLRGGATAAATARRLGARLVTLTPRHLAQQADVLVIDDPSSAAATPWLRAARRARVTVVSLHDWGLAPLASDVPVNQELRAAGGSAHRSEHILEPGIVRLRVPLSRRPRPPIVLIGLGGGRQAGYGRAVARALHARLAATAQDQAQVRLSLGFGADRRGASADGIARVEARRFRATLAAATVAVVGGGVTLWEAATLGTPVVAVPVVAAQARAVRCFAAVGLAVTAAEGGRPGTRRWAARVADAVMALLADAPRRRTMAARGPRLVDGNGAMRVAAAIRAAARRTRR